MRARPFVVSSVAASLLAIMGGGQAVAQQPRALAAQSAVSPDQIRQRAAKIKEARSLLADPEPTVRMAAFDQYTSSNDTVLQEVAYETGFASTDASMRALALKRRLMHMTSFAMEITDVVYDPRRPDRGGGDAIPRTMTWFIVATDERSGVLYVADHPMNELEGRKSQASLTVAGLTVNLNGKNVFPNCQGSMRLDDANVLVGQMTCKQVPITATEPILKIRTTVQ